MRSIPLFCLLLVLCAPVCLADVYPFATDPVTGAALGEKPVIYTHQGRELRFADEQSLAQFKKDPAPVLAKIDEKIITSQLKDYPLDNCPVTGEKLGTMGEPVNLVVNNRLIRLCCKGCIKKANTNYADVVKKLDAAIIAKQLPTYPLKTCVVSGDSLGDDATNVVVGTTLVRFCCNDCIKSFEKNPAKYLEKLNAK